MLLSGEFAAVHHPHGSEAALQPQQHEISFGALNESTTIGEAHGVGWPMSYEGESLHWVTDPLVDQDCSSANEGTREVIRGQAVAQAESYEFGCADVA